MFDMIGSRSGRCLRRALVVGLGLLALLSYAEPAGAADAVRARLSIATTETHPYYPGAQRFKEALEAETKGAIQVQVFPNAQAGDEAASLQLLRSGGLQFAEHVISLATSAFNEPKLTAWSLPFVYRDADAAYRAWDSELAEKSVAVFEKSGFRCLVFWDAGFRQLSSNRAVNAVADVKGLKVRTPNGAIYVDTWKALGGVPTPMAFTELYTALQTGVVDGTELPVQVFHSSKFAEVQKNVALINYTNDPICFSVSLKFFNALPAEQQQAVVKAAKASAIAERQAANSGFETAIQAVKAAGVNVTRPDTEAFRQAVAPVYEAYYQTAGEDGRALVKAILATAAK